MRTLVITLLALTASPALAAPSAPYWQPDLLSDAREADCEVTRVSGASLHYLDGQAIATARVHCADGRDLSARRPDEGLPFSFSECPDTGEAC